MRSRGRIPISDGDVKEAHRRTYQENESLRVTPVVQNAVERAPIEDVAASAPAAHDGTSSSTQTPSETMNSKLENTRASILIEIMSAAPINIEATIAHHADSIDPELLHLLEGRIAAARQLEQDDETVNGLIALYHRLKSEYERRTASPALRLLDTLLSMMIAGEDEDEEGDDERREEGGRKTSDDSGRSSAPRRTGRTMGDTTALVRARLQLAFDESLSLDTDVFTVAQQLAVGERRFVDELINEQVDGGEFVKEVEGLLKLAVEQQVAGNALLASETGVVGPEERERLRQVLAQREKTIERVEELLVLARQVWYHRR